MRSFTRENKTSKYLNSSLAQLVSASLVAKTRREVSSKEVN